jgi:hypothetical protein
MANRKFYVIEWLHRQKVEWFPLMGDSSIRTAQREQRERRAKYPEERFRIKTYIPAEANRG